MSDDITRRRLLQWGVTGAVATPLLAKAPFGAEAGAQTASPATKFRGEFYRFKIGTKNAIALSDGTWVFPKPKAIWAPDASPEAFREALQEYLLPDSAFTLHINILAIEHTTGKWVLVDAGARDFFGPTLGKLPVSLQAAGIAPENVTDILLSHAHADHFGGVFRKDETAFFPNATIHAGEIEADFWVNRPDIRSTLWDDATKAAFVSSAQAFFKNAGPRLRRYKAGEKLLGFITPMLTPGHTPGHCAFLIEDGGESLLHLVDVPPHHVLSFSHPEWEVGFDTDRKKARATRLRVFSESRKSGVRLMGYHLPFPGIGRLRAYKQGYEWLPETALFPAQ